MTLWRLRGGTALGRGLMTIAKDLEVLCLYIFCLIGHPNSCHVLA